MEQATVLVNRAPVLTLWAAVVAERMGYDHEAALTLGKAVAGLTAQAKGRRLGLFQEARDAEGLALPKRGLGEEFWVNLCGRGVPARMTDGGVRAVIKDSPIDPGQVRSYLQRAFGERLADVRRAMEALAGAFDPADLAERSFALYEAFRPGVAGGQRGWGQKGILALDRILALRPGRV